MPAAGPSCHNLASSDAAVAVLYSKDRIAPDRMQALGAGFFLRHVPLGGPPAAGNGGL